jgi:diaminohydroxyphosphoribosylaminopyrimidine deaminase/5-amino-6-(5-phosphoribosylamino)uracil reductase
MNVRLGADDLPGMKPGEPVRQPLRVLVDSRLRTPERAVMLGLPGETLIACLDPEKADVMRLESAGARVCVCPGSGDRVDLESLLRHLARREINEILVEAGPTLAGSLLQAHLVDEILLYLAPHLMGDDARGLFRLPGLARMQDRVELDILDIRMVGPDLRIRAVPKHGSGVSVS